MKTAAFVFAASAALVAAQGPTYDEATGKFTCPKANVAYCAGDSLKTDIIIRCGPDKVGQPGRCSDNLAGQPPIGVSTSLCYQTDASKGDAACEKNCVVYGSSGNRNGTFTLPAALCTPTYTASSTSYPTSTLQTLTTYNPTTITTLPQNPTSTSSTCIESSSTTYTPAPPPPCSTGSYGQNPPPPPAGNGTCTTCGGGSNPSGTYSPTNTPPSPTKTGPSAVVTAGAVANTAGGALALVGLVAAYLL